MLQYQLPMGIQYADNIRGKERIEKSLGDVEYTLAGISFFFTKIEAYAGMSEWLVRDLAIEDALWDEIKDTLEHNNQSYVNWWDLSDKEKNKNKVKLTVTYDMG